MKVAVGLILSALLAPAGWAQNSGELAGTKGLERLDFREVINSAKNKVFPTVVFIKCLRESFEGGKKVSVEVSGSGVLISANGEVLSNWHVIEKATEVRCLLYDGRAMDAKVLGSDKDVDLAVLQLKLTPGAESLPYAELGDSGKLKEGDFVMANSRVLAVARKESNGIELYSIGSGKPIYRGRLVPTLSAPIERITTPDVPIPYNVDLMKAVLPSVEQIAAKIRELVEF